MESPSDCEHADPGFVRAADGARAGTFFYRMGAIAENFHTLNGPLRLVDYFAGGDDYARGFSSDSGAILVALGPRRLWRSSFTY